MLTIQRNKDFVFPILIFLLVIILSIPGIHGSSIGMYNLYFYGQEYKDPNLLFGQIRPIRSDEYLVSTPWALAQVENGLEEPNTIYLAKQDLTISDAPTDNWSGIFEPQNWGFIILPVEQAFAFRWWFKGFMLTIAAYILFMMLSKNDLIVSVMGALSLTFSPFIQWWYSTSVTEIASYGIFTFIFFLKLINDRKLVLKIIDTLLLIYFASCFSLTLYPPFQIPFAVFLIVAGAGYVLSKLPSMNAKDIRHLIVNLSIVVMAISSILFTYYLSHQKGFTSLAHTIYPGIRQSDGGQMMSFRVLAGFYNIQLQNNRRTVPPILNDNQSEAASFFFLSFFLLPFFFYDIYLSASRKKPLDLPLFFTIMLLCVLLVWGTSGLPTGIAKLLLLNYIDEYRMLFMFGMANHLLIIYYLFRLKIEPTPGYKIASFVYSLGVSTVVYFIGSHLRDVAPYFIGSVLKILLISIAAGLMMFLLLYQKPRLFFCIFLLFTMASTYYVNPLYRGLSPMLGNEFSTSIQNIHEDDPQAAWMGYGNLLFGNYLAANGLSVLNGTYYYPSLDFWLKFDPTHKYDTLYNRYAHIVVLPTNNSNIAFELPHNDVVQLIISPCNPILEDLGIKYHVSSSPLSDMECLSEVDKINYPNMPIYIYKRVADGD